MNERVLKCARAERGFSSAPYCEDGPNSAPVGAANHILPTFDTTWAQQRRCTNNSARVADQDHPHKSVYKYYVSVKLYNQLVNGYDLKHNFRKWGGYFDWMNQPRLPRVAPISPIWWLINNQQDLILSVFCCLFKVRARRCINMIDIKPPFLQVTPTMPGDLERMNVFEWMSFRLNPNLNNTFVYLAHDMLCYCKRFCKATLGT